MSHPALTAIVAATHAVGRDRIEAAASGATFAAICAEGDVVLDPISERFATYDGVRIDRSLAQIPAPGFVVRARWPA